MPASSAGLRLVIESWMYGRATSSQRAPSSCRGCGTATPASRRPGATIAAVVAELGDEPREAACSGADRFCITGMMSRSSGRNAPIAVLIDSPRPANAVPKPSRLACEAARVFSSNMFRNSSSSTGVLACASAIVSPSS